MPITFRILPLADPGTPAAAPEFGWFQPFRVSVVKTVALAALLAQPVCPPPPVAAATAPPAIGWLKPFDLTLARKPTAHLLDGIASAEQIVPAATPSILGWQAPWAAPRAAKSFTYLLDGLRLGTAPVAAPQGWQGQFQTIKTAGVNPGALSDGFAWEASVQAPVTLTTDIGWLVQFGLSKPKQSLREGVTWTAQPPVTPVTLTTDFGWHRPFDQARPRGSNNTGAIAWAAQAIAQAPVAVPPIGWLQAFAAPQSPSRAPLQGFAWAAQAFVDPPLGWLTQFQGAQQPQTATADGFAWSPQGLAQPGLGWFTRFETASQPATATADGFAWNPQPIAAAPITPAPAFGWFGIWPLTKAPQIAVNLHLGWTVVPLNVGGTVPEEPPLIVQKPGGDGGGWRWRRVRPEIERKLDDVLELVEALPKRLSEKRKAIARARSILSEVTPAADYGPALSAIDKSLAQIARQNNQRQDRIDALAEHIETLIAELERKRLKRMRDEEALIWLLS